MPPTVTRNILDTAGDPAEVHVPRVPHGVTAKVRILVPEALPAGSPK